MATFLQTLLQAASAIAIRARPGFGPVEVAAILAIVSIFDRKQFEIFLPIWTFFGERRGAETRLDPMDRTISADASLLHVINVFVTRDGSRSQAPVFD